MDLMPDCNGSTLSIYSENVFGFVSCLIIVPKSPQCIAFALFRWMCNAASINKSIYIYMCVQLCISLGGFAWI